MGGRHGAPLIMPYPCSPGSQRLSIDAFIWGIVCLCTMVGSFRILKKAGELRQRQFVFIFIAAKIRQKTHCNFQISKDCDHQNIKIVELYILYQILCDDCSSTFTFGMRSYFAPLIQCQVQHKIKSECTRTYLPRTWLCCLLRKVSVQGHRAMWAKNFPFLYEDGPRTVMGVKW